MRNPGLYHYGIHTVEMLYSLMGPGCVRVHCVSDKGADVVTGHWKDGRLATVRGLRSGVSGGFGFTAYSEKATKCVSIRTTTIYRELLKRVVTFFEEKKSPLDLKVTIEIMAFIEAAYQSANNHGVGVKIIK